MSFLDPVEPLPKLERERRLSVQKSSWSKETNGLGVSQRAILLEMNLNLMRFIAKTMCVSIIYIVQKHVRNDSRRNVKKKTLYFLSSIVYSL